MSNLADKIDSVQSPINNIVIRLLLVGVAVFHMAMLMWEPTIYAERIGGFSGLLAPALIYSVCTAFIFCCWIYPTEMGMEASV